MEKYVIIYIHNYSSIQNYFTALKSLLCSASNSWQPLFLFTTSIILPFLKCHIDGIIQYIAFSNWLLYLVICISPPCFSWFDSSFPFSAKKYFIIWIYHSYLNVYLLKGILVASKFWKLWTKLLQTSVFRFVWGHKLSITLSKYTAAGSYSCIPNSNEREFLLPHILTSFWCCQGLDFDHSNRCVWYHTVVLSCSSLTTYGDKYLFIDLLAICISFFFLYFSVLFLFFYIFYFIF